MCRSTSSTPPGTGPAASTERSPIRTIPAAPCADLGRTRTRSHNTRMRSWRPWASSRPCESLPCPCLKPGAPHAPNATATPAPTAAPPTTTPSCTRPSSTQSIGFSKTKYPNIKRHAERAIRNRWPAVLVVNRAGVDARRDRLLRGRTTRSGHDRDEYPRAIGRGRGVEMAVERPCGVGGIADRCFAPDHVLSEINRRSFDAGRNEPDSTSASRCSLAVCRAVVRRAGWVLC